ncbi:hypothetical protein JCM8097_005502 [Rhodosporidiobolus ruineniae]
MVDLLGVPAPAPPRDPSLPAPLAVLRPFRPYYSPLQLDHLVHLQASTRARDDHHAGQPPARQPMSDHRIQHHRNLAAAFIERTAQRLGFPRRTIATAQKLYHRFHLHFPLHDFAYQDVGLAALLVASKLEDTLKKLRDIQIAGWQVLNMMDGGEGRGEGDLAAQEAHRPHLIGIERLLLQTISFNFNLHKSLSAALPSISSPSSSADAQDLPAETVLALADPAPTRDPFDYLLRLSSALPSLPPALLPPSPSFAQQEAVRKSLTQLAFLLLADLHRTLAPLSYPPHTCAAACLWTAGVLLVVAARAGATGAGESDEGGAWDGEMVGGWARETESEDEDIDDIAQTLLNLLIALCPSPPSLPSSSSFSTQTSPLFSPSSASPSEPSSSTAATTSNKPAQLSERDKHLLAAGVPNAFTHSAALPSSSSSSFSAGDAGAGGAVGGFMSPDRLTSAKILLRASRPSPRPAKRPRPPPSSDVDPDEPEELSRARRWAALPAGLEEVARLRDEQLERDALRAQERAEREAEAAEAAATEEGGAGPGGGRSASRAKTAEEREAERRERRERGRAGSVRYTF